MTILDVLAAEARERVAEARARVPLDDLRRRALDTPASDGFPFERALARPGLSFICEVKRASPSKGLIAPYFPYAAIARDYEAAGAAAISVLTEPRHFLGRDAYLAEIARVATVPLLRKDFTVDAYQVVEARALGASAVLLICAILSDTQLGEFLGLAESLGLSALTEAHTAAEVERAVRAGARVIGVNNRNLHDFTVDTGTSAALRALVPPGRLFVAESGVTSPDDVATAVRQGADAVLVGEALMRADDRQAALSELRAASWVTPAVKICGITRAGEVAVLNEVRPEYAGFVFAPSSRRYVEPATAASLRSLLDPRITTVGVFMDAGLAEVRAVVDSGAVTVVQL
ncbi:MAG: indole-3-glycerol phosphate synthase TrpC, partial [Propionibacteriaceae bacterium]|nr:indole-3-glycerol phosphate synthase TrpC [Propionibacteriaceae bacterium]